MLPHPSACMHACHGVPAPSAAVSKYTQWQQHYGTVCTCLHRRNTYNGRVYKEDPTIMAWDLLNEPRETSGNYGNVQSWIDMMASFVKGQDPNHMAS